MPTEELFQSDKLPTNELWTTSPFNKGQNYINYIDPMYRRTIADFPAFTSFWALRNEYEVANYPIRIAPTASNFDIWNTYRVNAISTLYTDFDTRNLESKQVSPSIPGGFYKRGTKLDQFYIVEEMGKTYLLQINFEFRTLSYLEDNQDDFTLATGRRFRDWLRNKLTDLASVNKELEDQSDIPEDDTSGLLGSIKDFIVNLVTESNVSDIIAVWVPVDYSATELDTSRISRDSDPFGFNRRRDQRKAKREDKGFPLLPIGLIGTGLFTGMLPLTLVGTGLLFLNNRTEDNTDEDSSDNPNIRDFATQEVVQTETRIDQFLR